MCIDTSSQEAQRHRVASARPLDWTARLLDWAERIPTLKSWFPWHFHIHVQVLLFITCRLYVKMRHGYILCLSTSWIPPEEEESLGMCVETQVTLLVECAAGCIYLPHCLGLAYAWYSKLNYRWPPQVLVLYLCLISISSALDAPEFW